MAQLARQDALLRQPFCDHSEHIVAEAVDAIRYQYATTLADWCCCAGCRPAFSRLVECRMRTPSSSSVLAKPCAGTSSAIALQYEQFEMERSAFLVRPELTPRQAPQRPLPGAPDLDVPSKSVA